MTKQTAVEWYIEESEKMLVQFYDGLITSNDLSDKKQELLTQAKQMEREQRDNRVHLTAPEEEVEATPDYEAIVKESERLNHYRTNAEEDYVTTPISVLRYITELESALSFIKSKTESNETQTIKHGKNGSDIEQSKH
jgi:hypothetical protein